MPPKRKPVVQAANANTEEKDSSSRPKRTRNIVKKITDADEVDVKSTEKPGRRTKKESAKKEADVSDSEDKDVKPAKTTAKRTKKQAVKKEVELSDSEEEVVKPAKATGRRTKKKTAKKEVEVSGSEEEIIKPAKATGRRTKKETAKKDEEASDPEENDDEEKPAGRKTKKVAAAVKNKTATSYDDIDLNNCSRKSEQGKEWNFKISSWNVDGIRAWIKKGGLDFLENEKPDVFCLQETKCPLEKLPTEATEVDGYKVYWACSNKDGYAGVALYTKNEPLSVQYGIGDEEHDEGRIITAEFVTFYVISVYVPNSGRGLVTLPKRMKWNDGFRKFVGDLNKKKPVIICGDMNVSHLEIDLANPKTNTKNAGFTKQERDGMTDFLSDGYVDTFRKIYPDKIKAYTFWTYLFNCRAKDVGWRLDYFIVSERLMENVCDNIIRKEVFGSDHCPLTLFLTV